MPALAVASLDDWPLTVPGAGDGSCAIAKERNEQAIPTQANRWNAKGIRKECFS